MLVWIGYDDNRDFPSGYSSITKNIWADTMEEIKDSSQDNWYQTPENVVGVILDAVTGEYTNNQNKAYIYYFLKGSEPN